LDKNLDSQIRVALFQWLGERSARNGGVFTWKELTTGFVFGGNVITLIGQTGIWFPKGWAMPVSITTSFKGPYPDTFKDGILSYRYRGKDPNHRDNKGMREAFKTRTPLIYFEASASGRYAAVWPVYIIADNPAALCITAEVGMPSAAYDAYEETESPLAREYSRREVDVRIHQKVFRDRVLTAYKSQCTLCGLRHEELLDAAHILPDKDPDGKPEVPNGLSLCKIHHVSYDKKIIGISPDYEVKVSEKVMKEKDGPMLTYGLQAMEGRKLILPNRDCDHPNRDKLKRRWDEFLKHAI